MTFLWPNALWLLAGVPLLAAFYVWLLKRRKAAIAYPNLALVRAAMGKSSSVRRHIPPALFLGALTLMILALARPAALVTLPSQHETVILAIDVSGSMRADDVKPTRLAAAQAAARTFINSTPKTTVLRPRPLRGRRGAVAAAIPEPGAAARGDRAAPAAARDGGGQRDT